MRNEKKSGSVLIVEENREMNRFICESLAEGYRVAAAFDGKDGLEKALAIKPDLILAGMMMPGMSSEELVHVVRDRAELDDTAIVILTAGEDDALRIRLLREGAQDYLATPFAVEELHARVGNHVARKIAAEALRQSEGRLRQLTELAPEGIFVADLNGRYTDVNIAGCEMLGYAREEIIGKTIVDFIPAEDVDKLMRSKEQLMQGDAQTTEWVLRHKNGDFVPVEISANILPDGRWQAFVRDISERKRIEHALQDSHAELKRAQSVARIGSWWLNIERDELRWSDEAYRIFGIAQGVPLSYAAFLAAVHPEDRDYVDSKWKAALRGESYDIEHRILVNGEIKWVREKAELEIDPVAGLVSGIGTVQDITESKLAEARLRQAAIVFDSTKEGIIVTDADCRIIAVNQAMEEITGFKRHEIIGQTPRFQSSGRQNPEFYWNMWQALESSDQWQGELWNRRKNGEVFPVWENISVVKDSDGRITHYVAVLSDISSIKQAEDRLNYIAHHDTLTGLPNRLLYRASLGKTLEQAKRHRRKAALLFLDLDRFKMINDTLGHAAGDLLLQEIGRRLKKCVRAEDLVARLGGDEFTVTLEEISQSEDAAHLAEKIIEEIARPIAISGNEVTTSTSVGIGLFPDDADNAEDLAKAADAAMYRAKEQGRNTYRFYADGINSHAREQLALESALRRALTQDELMVYYQPQFDVLSGAPVGMEALLRWQHPERGFLTPEGFIAVAEESGLIGVIGDWVVRQVYSQARHWIAEGLQLPRIAINVSGRQILYNDIFDVVQSAQRECGLRPEDVRVEIEITETVLQSVQSMERNAHVLERLRSLGIQIALDDFGTGYSSLSRLKHLPIDTLKIDRAFVRNIPEDTNDKAITAAIVSMGHSLGLRVIAEGVERDEQLDFLREQGCDEVQGYLLGKPVPAKAMEQLLSRREPAMTVIS